MIEIRSATTAVDMEQARELLGCFALRPLGEGACKMKRLYVRPAARGEQLGRRLAERIGQEAHEAGYSQICLDTLPSMGADLGIPETESYVFNPVAQVKFLELEVTSRRASPKAHFAPAADSPDKSVLLDRETYFTNSDSRTECPYKRDLGFADITPGLSETPTTVSGISILCREPLS